MNEAFLSRTMEKHGNAVYALALCQLQKAEDAEHVFEDVFKSYARQRNAESWKEGQVKTWLLRMTVDFGRTQNCEVIDFEKTKIKQNGLGDLWAAVSRLPLEERLVFHLTYGEELSPENIAEILNMTRPMVKVYLNRARNTMRRERNHNERIS